MSLSQALNQFAQNLGRYLLSIPIRPILVVPLRGAVMRKGGVTIVSVSRITILVSVI